MLYIFLISMFMEEHSTHVLHNCVFSYHVHNKYVDNFMSTSMCLHWGKVNRMANAKLITQ